MTDEQREKRMAELLWSCDSYEEMCQRVVGLEAEMERLREKDRNQRKQLTDVQSALEKANDKRSPWRARAEQAEGDNAKLRELCAGLWNVMWACAEQRCPHRHEDCFVVNGNGDGPKGHGECWYKLRLRELGIEVDEWTADRAKA